VERICVSRNEPAQTNSGQRAPWTPQLKREASTMSAQDHSTQKWINPLLEKLELARPKSNPIDIRILWAELEEYHLPDRIHTVTANINHEAGYHVLNLLDYLPPQRSVVRVVYPKNKFEFVMAIVLLANGPAVTFHSARVVVSRWDRYIPGRSSSREHPNEMIRGFRAPEVTDRIIQEWFSFLLSGFSREFEGALRAPMSARGDSRINSLFRKASA
jgi:hypothetical protein